MSVALLGGYVADAALGDPRRGHPVAGFGNIALALERRIYAPTRMRGALFAASLVFGVGLAADFACRIARRHRFGATIVFASVTWASLGGRSLARAARCTAEALERGDVDGARQALPSLVGRDVSELDETMICRAVVESVAENTSDAVVGALVWGALLGPVGVVTFRAANTLDAMVGNRSERYERFGWAAARLDDVLCWPAARLTALLTVACAAIVNGSARDAARAVLCDGGAHPSPNAGRVEAAFAGALGLRLGGPLAYDGRTESRNYLGNGREPEIKDVDRCVRLAAAVGVAALTVCVVFGSARGRVTNR